MQSIDYDYKLVDTVLSTNGLRTCIYTSDKLHATGVLPVYKTVGAVCADICTAVDFELQPGKSLRVPTLLGFIFPDLRSYISMYPRSSLLINYNVIQPVSIIDSDFVNPISIPLYNAGCDTFIAKAGDRLAQIQYFNNIEKPSAWKNKTQIRNQNGFGGTGK